jgi:integrase
MKREIEADKVGDLTAEGYTPTEIARELRTSVSTVMRRKRDLGLLKDGEGGGLAAWLTEHPEVVRAFAAAKPSTRRNYAYYFKMFAKWAGEEPDVLAADSWEQARDRTTDFRLHLEKQGASPNTIRTYTTMLKKFYRYNRTSFDRGIFSNGTAVTSKEVNEKELLTAELLAKILDVSTTMERAMFMCQFQSGLGAFELVNLKVQDVADIDKAGDVNLRITDGVITLKLRREKTNFKFITFLGHDSIQHLRKWIALRQSGKLLTASTSNEGAGAKITSGNDYLFVTFSKSLKRWSPVAPSVYAKYLRTRVRQLGWITDDNMRKAGQLNVYRPHALRMSFSHHMKHDARIEWDYVEHMMAHRLNATESAYVKMDEVSLRQAYKEGEPFISLTPIETVVSDDKYNELMNKMAEMEKIMNEYAGLLEDSEIKAVIKKKKMEKSAYHI